MRSLLFILCLTVTLSSCSLINSDKKLGDANKNVSIQTKTPENTKIAPAAGSINF